MGDDRNGPGLDGPAIKQEILRLSKAGQAREAISLLKKLAAGGSDVDAQLVEWSAAQLNRLIPGGRAPTSEKPVDVEALRQTAEQLFEKYDYAQAAVILAQIPASQRTPEVRKLLKLSVDLRDEAESLLGELKIGIETRRVDDLEPVLDRLLEICPTSAYSKRLKATLATYKRLPKARRRYRFGSGGSLLEAESPRLPPSLIAALAVASVLAIIGWQAWTGQKGTLVVHVERAADDRRNLQLKIGELKIDLQDVDVSVSLSPGEYAVEVFSGVERLLGPLQVRVDLHDPNQLALDLKANGLDLAMAGPGMPLRVDSLAPVLPALPAEAPRPAENLAVPPIKPAAPFEEEMPAVGSSEFGRLQQRIQPLGGKLITDAPPGVSYQTYLELPPAPQNVDALLQIAVEDRRIRALKWTAAASPTPQQHARVLASNIDTLDIPISAAGLLQKPNLRIVKLTVPAGRWDDSVFEPLAEQTRLQGLALKTDDGSEFSGEFLHRSRFVETLIWIHGFLWNPPQRLLDGVSRFTRLKSMRITRADPNPAAEASRSCPLPDSRDLKWIHLVGIPIQAQTLPILTRCTELEQFASTPRIADKSFADMKLPVSTKSVSLFGCQISDAELAAFQFDEKLIHFQLATDGISGPGLSCLKNATSLSPSGMFFRSTALNDKGVDVFLTLPQLSDVDVMNSKVTIMGVRHLASMGHIKTIRCRQSQCSRREAAKIKAESGIDIIYRQMMPADRGPPVVPQPSNKPGEGL